MIPLHQPALEPSDYDAVMTALRSGRLTMGPNLIAFEHAMARRTRRMHGVGVSSGSAAMEIALKALDIGPGDQVLVSAFGYSPNVNAVLHVGATPVFVDADPVTLNMDPAKVDARTNSAGNDFPFALQPEKSYMAIATREGYQSDTLTFNTVGVRRSVKVDKKFTLRMDRKEPDSIVVTINEPIRLNSIYYDFNDDKILPDAEPDLQYLTDIMKQYPDIKIELSSHTDARGNDDYNQKLSQRRAESARRWLVERGGINADRIAPVGYGEKQLLNQCQNGVECTEDEHRFNRRTEFKIISGPTTITIERKEKKE